MKDQKKISSETILLLFVIAIATVLRFWNISNMQYMHDELSAIIRSQTSSFPELIYKIKTTDVHPVGVPIFVHYWTMLFGKSEVVVKLPFILFSLIAIYYSYKIAEKWFNSTVAIITVAFIATLQFAIMYGQLERPYASGMMFSVLMVWCWTNFFFEEKNKNKYSIGFVVFASLCTYNHYFSLLFATVVSGTGFLFLNKENAKIYILMCFCVALLFVPGIPVLFSHLSAGSGGEASWLGKPQPDWFLTFTRYLFHYSSLIYFLVIVLFLLSFYFRNKERKIIDKMRVIALTWGLMVPVLAYLFSIYRTPVLQFSTVTFSLPFLLMFIFSFYGELKTSLKTAIVAVIMIVNCYTLCANRKHFSIFYKQPYEEMAIISKEIIDRYGEKNVSVAHSAIAGFVDFYSDKYGKKFNYFRVDKPDTKPFLKYLEDQKTNYFVAGNLPLEFIQLIKERYPYIIKKEEGFTFSVYCFSKIKPEKEIKEKLVFSEKNDFVKTSARWTEPKNVVENIQEGKVVCIMDSTEEYGTTFSAKLIDIINSRNNIINVCAEISTNDSASDPTLVLEIHDESGSLLWRGNDYKSFVMDKEGFKKIYSSYLFSDFDFKKHPDAEMKIYIWNRDKKEARISNINIEVVESNPFIYGLYEPIE
ncbi:MAG: glycosyltransferase family 39 protein [Bacteroidia bacterium]